MSTYSKGEITAFVKKLIRANHSLWLAIGDCGELVKSDMFREIDNNSDEYQEVIKQIAERYNKLGEESFAQPELNSSYFQDFESLVYKLSDFIDK